MTKKMLPVLAALVLALVFGVNVRADTNGTTASVGTDPPITIDAGWYGFCFGLSGSAATLGCQNQGIGETGNPITFTATTDVLFNITDAYEKGDTFTVDINPGAITFTTDTVPVDASGAVTDPNAAFLDPTYSHGSWLLGPGSYTVDIYAAASPFSGGGAYAEVVTAVPEPTSLLLLLAVIGSIGAGMRLKKRLS